MSAGSATFATAIGVCGIAWNADGVCAVQLPERSETATRDRLRRTVPDSEPATAPAEIQTVIDRIAASLAGVADDLRDVAVDFGDVPDFARQVYEIARGVEPGQTITYGEIAARLGAPRAAREVGQALGRNPVPLIVPCHRVLAASGKVGGFSAPGGVTTKLRLLRIEGAAPNGQPALF